MLVRPLPRPQSMPRHELVLAISKSVTAPPRLAICTLCRTGVGNAVPVQEHPDRGTVQKITAWEIAEPSPLAARLAQARAVALGSWITRQRAGLEPPPGVDAPALNALLIAAVQHMVLSATTTGGFAGVSLDQEENWNRIKTVIVGIIDCFYRPAPLERP